MDISDVITFVLVILFMLAPVLRRKLGPPEGMGDLDEEYKTDAVKAKTQQKDMLKEFFREFDVELDEPKEQVKPPPPPPLPSEASANLPKPNMTKRLEKKFEFHSDMEDYKTHSKIESRRLETNIVDDKGAHLISDHMKNRVKQEAYKVRGKRGTSLSYDLIDEFSLQEVILMQEILSKPKALRDDF